MATSNQRQRPKAGSLPLPENDPTPLPDPSIEAARQAGMPFIAKKLERRTKPLPSKIDMAITGLQQARAEAEKQAGWLQDLVFDDWIRRCVVEVDDPRDWTQARVLYEDYLVHARTFGNKGNEKRVVRQELVTETQWGRLIATLYPKKRRTAGWFYPLKCVRGG